MLLDHLSRRCPLGHPSPGPAVTSTWAVWQKICCDSLIAINQHLDVEKVERGTAGARFLFPPPASGAFCLGVTELRPSPALPGSCCTQASQEVQILQWSSASLDCWCGGLEGVSWG